MTQSNILSYSFVQAGKCFPKISHKGTKEHEGHKGKKEEGEIRNEEYGLFLISHSSFLIPGHAQEAATRIPESV